MKVRIGFVSNSSSSSFVIHRSYLTDEQVKVLQQKYGELSNSDRTKDYIYDDNGVDFTVEKNYIHFNAYCSPEEWQDLISSLNLPEGAILNIYS